MKEFFKIQTATGNALAFGDEWGINQFPDGQQQFWIESSRCPEVGSVMCSLCRPEHVEMLWQILGAVLPKQIQINYLYGARCDKNHAGSRLVCNVAEAMVARLRATVRGARLQVVAPHCEGFEVSERIWPIQPELLDHRENVGWLFPDHSALRRFNHLVPDRTEYRVCEKVRDQVTGQITHYEVPDFSISRLLVVDDLCDGGRTFLNIAQDLPDKKLALYVTHGGFSSDAIPKLLERYERIYTTNSLPSVKEGDRVHVLDVWESAIS